MTTDDTDKEEDDEYWCSGDTSSHDAANYSGNNGNNGNKHQCTCAPGSASASTSGTGTGALSVASHYTRVEQIPNVAGALGLVAAEHPHQDNKVVIAAHLDAYFAGPATPQHSSAASGNFAFITTCNVPGIATRRWQYNRTAFADVFFPKILAQGRRSDLRIIGLFSMHPHGNFSVPLDCPFYDLYLGVDKLRNPVAGSEELSFVSPCHGIPGINQSHLTENLPAHGNCACRGSV
ncbi:hypothetical protein Pelo_14466 [Pelomyxa schiedti]|nr:hypothetical protein Pelo_14466 [Pelomyxa schiedti]